MWSYETPNWVSVVWKNLSIIEHATKKACFEQRKLLVTSTIQSTIQALRMGVTSCPYKKPARHPSVSRRLVRICCPYSLKTSSFGLASLCFCTIVKVLCIFSVSLSQCRFSTVVSFDTFWCNLLIFSRRSCLFLFEAFGLFSRSLFFYPRCIHSLRIPALLREWAEFQVVR